MIKYIATPAPPVPPAINMHLGENAQKLRFAASSSRALASF